MTIARVIVSLVLAALMVATAIRKLSHTEEVVRSYRQAGVPEDKLNYLAAILLAGAAGLAAGLLWTPLGIAAAACVTVYFGVAIAFHLRAGDARRIPTPLGFGLLAIAALVLALVT
jgi:hypothetical protein